MIIFLAKCASTRLLINTQSLTCGHIIPLLACVGVYASVNMIERIQQ